MGDDLYEIGGKAAWAAMEAFYKAFRKPFVIAEWASWGYDSPGFARHMFAWARSHLRTIGLIYFNRGWAHGRNTFVLKSKPRTLAVYRQAARQSALRRQRCAQAVPVGPRKSGAPGRKKPPVDQAR